MPHKLLYLTMLILASFEISAQKVVFDLNARASMAQAGEYTKLDSFNSYATTRLDDTTVIRRYMNYVYNDKRDYLANTAFEINGLFTFKLSERFSLRTGLGLNYGTYSIGSGFYEVSSDVYKVDTVYQEIFVPGPGSGSICDCYENSFSEVYAGLDRRTHQQLLNLVIPADIGYDIIPGKLSIRGGAYFQTPLYAAASQLEIDLEMTTMDDMTKCKWVRVENKTTALHGIRNFQWGVSAWAVYDVLPRLQVEVGVRQQVNDMYVKEDYQSFSFDNNSYKPLTFSAGVNYRLYKGFGVE